MALQTIAGGGFPLPEYFMRRGNTGGLNAQTVIDAASEKHAVTFIVPKTGTIDRLVFRTSAVTTSETLRIGLQTTSTTDGFPTGTAYGGMTVGTQAAPAANTLYEVTLGTGATATAGDKVSAVIEFDSAVGNLSIAAFGSLRDLSTGFPYVSQFAAAAWGKQTDVNNSPLIGVRYSDGSYAHVGGMVAQTVAATAFNSGSTPDEIGNRFTLVAPIRCSGAWCIANPSEDFEVVLYNSSSTVIASALVDKDQRAVAVGTYGLHRLAWAPVTMAIGTYRLVFKPTTATSITIGEYTVTTAAQLDCNPGGQTWHKTSRTDAGAWTDLTTARVDHMGIMIDQIDDGVSAGGGGLLTNPGMGGGFRG